MRMSEQSIEASGAFRNSASRALPSFKTPLGVVVAFSAGWIIWNAAPPDSLSQGAAHFLATLTVAVILWISNTFDEYVVALMLLASWVLLDIVPANVALDGFSHQSWFFVVAALGIGAAVAQSGLLRRLAAQILGRLPITAYKTHSFLLFASGLALTPLLPSAKARVVVALPVSQAMAQATGFSNRSNGSAALAMSAMIGFSHMSFGFLTGSEFCLLGWNLLSESAKSEFGWTTWFLAALPVSLVVFFFVFLSIQFFFSLSAQERLNTEKRAAEFRVDRLGPLTKSERIALLVLLATFSGWVTAPLHGVKETWVALLGLLALLATGVLDKGTFKNGVDWGLVLFFGIVNGMAVVSRHLEVDRWLVTIVEPLLASVASGHCSFLIAVVVLVFCARFFLRKAAAAVILPLLIMPYGQAIGIHPGVVLITILAASECFLLTYQDGPYQIAYSSTSGQAFSHRQARKILAAKFLATLVAVAISIPYWRFLGLIE